MESQMQELKELLDSILRNTTFSGPRAENVSPTQLRDHLIRRGWPDDEVFNAQRARPVVSGESICQLTVCLHSVLSDYVDANENSVGLSFPAGDFLRTTAFQRNGVIGKVWESSVETLAEAIVKGAAVLGPERVTCQISSWLQGEPVKYKTIALLNALPIKEPVEIEDGVRIDILPFSTDKLPANLPRPIGGMSAEEYMGRPILVVDSTASPAFFRPQPDRSGANVRAASKLKLNIDTFCQALSLNSNSYVDLGFFWHDYQELEAFSFTSHGSSWYPSSTRVKKRPYYFSVSTSMATGVKKVNPQAEKETLELQPAQVSQICNNLQGKDAKKITLSLARWIASKDFEKSQVDQFIDLRIALESLYLQDFHNEQSREMRFRLALYGAWHLGVDFEERKKIHKRIRDAYDTASGAVHGGELKKTLEIQELLSDAQDLCRRGILKVLSEGYPSQEQWGDMILGVEYDE